METGFWAARLERELDPPEEMALYALLPPARAERLCRMKNAARRREVLCAYGLLRLALRQTLGWMVLPEVAVSRTGKPWFPAYPGVQFSISHTDGAVLAGISEQPLGVDIERIRPVSESLMRRVADTDSPEQFFRVWVCVEAAGKRDGRGIGAILPMGNRPPRLEGLYRTIETFPGYAAGAAVSAGTIPAARLYTVSGICEGEM